MVTEGDYLTFALQVWDNYDRSYFHVLSQYQVQREGSVIPATYEIRETAE